jgi:hypothetical protein
MFAAVHTVPSTAFEQVLELPPAISPTMAGIAVGVVTAVLVFAVFALVIMRRTRAPQIDSLRDVRASANEVVFIPPYAAGYPSSSPMPVARPVALPISVPGVGGQKFVPSTALSARAFAKMGFAFGERVEGVPLDPLEEAYDRFEAPLPPASVEPTPRMHPIIAPPPAGAPVPPAPRTQPMVSAVETGPASEVSFPAAQPVARKEPSPLGVIPYRSNTLQTSTAGARIDDLSFEDNAATEFCEPFFDEPPQPPMRGSRPKIRKITPEAPRFANPIVPDATPTTPRIG